MNPRGYAKASEKWTKVSNEFKPHYDERKSKRIIKHGLCKKPRRNFRKMF